VFYDRRLVTMLLQAKPSDSIPLKLELLPPHNVAVTVVVTVILSAVWYEYNA
jgi:ammonia channel protein AmtB